MNRRSSPTAKSLGGNVWLLSALATIALATLLLTLELSASQSAPSGDSQHSKLRIVRLSEVRGLVALDHRIGKGFQHAFVNLPITENDQLQTGEGRVEVEFEDSSTLRLAPFSLVDFSRLRLLTSGAKITIIRVLKGTVYASVIPDYIMANRSNDLRLICGQNEIRLRPASHVRIQITSQQARLAITEGKADFDNHAGLTVLKRKKTYIFGLSATTPPMVSHGIERMPQDDWDSWSAEAHQRNTFGPKRRTRWLHDVF